MQAGNKARDTREGWRKKVCFLERQVAGLTLCSLCPQLGSVFLTLLCSAGLKPFPLTALALSPSLYLPVFTLSIYLFLPHSVLPFFCFVLLCQPVFLLLLLFSLLSLFYFLSSHDINRKGRLCSPREIYCFFKACHGFLCSCQWASRLSLSSSDKADKPSAKCARACVCVQACSILSSFE